MKNSNSFFVRNLERNLIKIRLKFNLKTNKIFLIEDGKCGIQSENNCLICGFQCVTRCHCWSPYFIYLNVCLKWIPQKALLACGKWFWWIDSSWALIKYARIFSNDNTDGLKHTQTHIECGFLHKFQIALLEQTKIERVYNILVESKKKRAPITLEIVIVMWWEESERKKERKKEKKQLTIDGIGANIYR